MYYNLLKCAESCYVVRKDILKELIYQAQCTRLLYYGNVLYTAL